MKTDTYRKGNTYRFHMVSGASEPAEYLGKNCQGMHRFLLGGGQVWTGHTANVTAEE